MVQETTITEDVEYVPHFGFASEHVEDALFGEASPVFEIPRHSLSAKKKDKEADDGRKKVLSPEEEEALFFSYNFAKYRLARLAEQQEADDWRIKMWRKRVTSLRNDIACANLYLVRHYATSRAPAFFREKLRGLGISVSDRISAGIDVLFWAIDRFDISRGLKFSTFFTNRLWGYFADMVRNARRHNGRFVGGLDVDAPTNYHEELEQKLHAINRVRSVLDANAANLTEQESVVVAHHFGFFGGEERTLTEIGEDVLGLTTGRISQIRSKALAKLRTCLKDTSLMASG